jgi:uncharacterized protein (DUF2236 family)
MSSPEDALRRDQTPRQTGRVTEAATTRPGSRNPIEAMRARIASEIFHKVAGADGPANARHLHAADGPRRFSPDRPIHRVHADASMFVGALRALLLQSLHPLAMAAVAEHSGFRGDPWGRVARTSHFLALTTYGTEQDAEAAAARVRAVHAHISGVAPDGREYSASDPHLLAWVHIAEADSFLAAYQRYGSSALNQRERDAYIADMAQVAAAIGVIDPPITERELHIQLAEFRPELRGTPQARAAARFLLVSAPLPVAIRPAYAVLGAAAIGLLPWWTRWPLRLPYLPIAEATVGRLAGESLVRTTRWIMSASPPALERETTASRAS